MYGLGKLLEHAGRCDVQAEIWSRRRLGGMEGWEGVRFGTLAALAAVRVLSRGRPHHARSGSSESFMCQQDQLTVPKALTVTTIPPIPSP